jgi:hypothetical protein
MALLDRVQLTDASLTAENLNRLQSNVERALGTIAKADPLFTVKFGAVANVDTRLPHNLGRPLIGYRQVRASAAAVIYDGSPSSDPSKFFNVKSSVAGVTITFEAF